MAVLSWLLWFLGSLCACPQSFLLSIQRAHARKLSVCTPRHLVSPHLAGHTVKTDSWTPRAHGAGFESHPPLPRVGQPRATLSLRGKGLWQGLDPQIPASSHPSEHEQREIHPGIPPASPHAPSLRCLKSFSGCPTFRLGVPLFANIDRNLL